MAEREPAIRLRLAQQHNPWVYIVAPPVVSFLTPFLGEGSPTKNRLQKKGILILSSLLEALVWLLPCSFAE